jgi:ABC-type nitrate/sulfonate/bicarbonate transport system substrate-binding protein
MKSRIHSSARLALLGLLTAGVLLCCGCQQKQPAGGKVPPAATPASPGAIIVGYGNSPLLGPLYAAQEQIKSTGKPAGWELKQFGSGGDIGYSLIAGEIDAGFIETDKALKLLKAPGGEKLKIAGAIEFPYGATLVVRKDLKVRLSDLAGKHLAALEADCILNHQFTRDAQRHGLDPKTLRYSYMPFAEMLPALEAKAIDGALVKGAYGVVAELAGHKILYQNWDIKAGVDDCCPPSIAQTELFLVVREQAADKIKPLITALSAASALPPFDIRQAVSKNLGYPPAALEQYPVSSFTAVSAELRKHLGEQKCLPVR